MEHGGGSLHSLIWVVTIAFVIPIVLYKLRLTLLPVVVAEIIAGLLLGKSGLQLVKEDPWVSLLSLLGFIYLMFLSGLEIDFSSFRSKRGRDKGSFQPLTVAVIIFAGIFLISGVFSYALYTAGLIERVFLMTLIISTISLGVVVPVLKERQLVSHPLGQTLLLIAVLADFVSMILLAVYVSLLSSNITQMLFLVLFFVLVALIYWLVRTFASGKVFRILSESTVQFSTRAIFALLLIIVFLSESLGVEHILGAFLAGVIVSLMKPGKHMVHQLESFGYGFLIPIFFVMVGVNLELRPLLTDTRILILIPVLLAFIFLSKMIPMLVLKKWFGWRDVLSSGILLSTTLSLVIAASTLALDLGIIDKSLHGALILVAIISCILFPVISSQLAPKRQVPRRILSIIGMSHISAPVVQELWNEDVYELRIYTTESTNMGISSGLNNRQAAIHKVRIFDEILLFEKGAFDADIVVFAAMDDEVNIRLARRAKELTSGRILVRIENPDLQLDAGKEGFEVFSTLYAARTVLRALIESPGALQLIAEPRGAIQEVSVNQLRFHMLPLRQFPLLDHLLVLRVYRGESFLIPHGNTEIRRGDRLLVSGEPEWIEEFRRKLE